MSSWLELNPGVIPVTPRFRQTAEQLSAEEIMLCNAFHGSRTECTGGLSSKRHATCHEGSGMLEWYEQMMMLSKHLDQRI